MRDNWEETQTGAEHVLVCMRVSCTEVGGEVPFGMDMNGPLGDIKEAQSLLKSRENIIIIRKYTMVFDSSSYSQLSV